MKRSKASRSTIRARDWLGIGFLAWALLPSAGFTGTIVVDTQIDSATPCGAGACSLRGAVLASNANPGLDTIVLPAGLYELSVSGPDEDSAATGDLDITGPVEIHGEGAETTVIDGLEGDRIFDVFAAASSVTFTGLTLRKGSARNGGCLYARADSTLREVVVTGCRGEIWGGGAFNESSATMTIADSTFEDNHLTDLGGSGGGIYNAGGAPPVGRVLIEGSTFTRNRAGSSGEGGALYSEGSSTIENSTLSANEAFLGGALFNGFFMELNASTLSGNTLDTVCNRDFMTFRSSIVNGVCFDLSNGGLQSFGYNVESPGNTCGLGGLGDRVNVSSIALALTPLGDFGGPTATHSIGSTSVALGNVTSTPSCLLTDQRGVARPQSLDCDSGSFEREPTLFADGFESGDTAGWSGP